MNYNPVVHKIESKNQSHILDGSPNQENTYNNQYQYNNTQHPNAVSSITDVNSGLIQSFLYDDNGNLTRQAHQNGRTADYQWDDQNRLKSINVSNSVLQHSVFDASGIRTLKADGTIHSSGQNGNVGSELIIDSYKLYASPFTVIDNFGYVTKHYYSGSKRMASMYSEHTSNLPSIPVVNPIHVNGLNALHLNDLDVIADGFQINNVTVNTANGQQAASFPFATFYYHSDHLGSTSAISDETGSMYQCLLYLPWGELMAEQNAIRDNWTAEYRFNAKEQDEFTGLYDYGARFYDPVTSMFIGVDPLADMFPNWTPYH